MTKTASRTAVIALIATAASPWGPVHVVASDTGVAAIEHDWSADAVARLVGDRLGGRVAQVEAAAPGDGRERFLRAGLRAVEEVAAGHEPNVELPLDWRGISAWDRRVLEGVRTLRRGEVTSYGRLARRIGAPGAARAVGAALGRNPFWLLIPCHRVVAGDGSIGGYGGGSDAIEIKRDLLAREGVAVPVAQLVG
ncbi:MAG TPA: methylated-DNA--[protein]-cysteine S-methyltransferase [Candidatus Saccharimonadia bacterium]|nr:methylated-DNA--[protein]-cysteine S-methyltransferase [Candidatus Saccharimonadia bacterium]